MSTKTRREYMKRHSFEIVSRALADSLSACVAIVRTSKDRAVAEHEVSKAILASCKPIMAELAKQSPTFDASRFMAPIVDAVAKATPGAVQKPE